MRLPGRSAPSVEGARAGPARARGAGAPLDWDDHLTCLVCGKQQKNPSASSGRRAPAHAGSLSRAVRLKPDYPMAAPGYSRQRSEMAKRVGLGQRVRRHHDASSHAAARDCSAIGDRRSANGITIRCRTSALVMHPQHLRPVKASEEGGQCTACRRRVRQHRSEQHLQPSRDRVVHVRRMNPIPVPSESPPLMFGSYLRRSISGSLAARAGLTGPRARVIDAGRPWRSRPGSRATTLPWTGAASAGASASGTDSAGRTQ